MCDSVCDCVMVCVWWCVEGGMVRVTKLGGTGWYCRLWGREGMVRGGTVRCGEGRTWYCGLWGREEGAHGTGCLCLDEHWKCDVGVVRARVSKFVTLATYWSTQFDHSYLWRHMYVLWRSDGGVNAVVPYKYISSDHCNLYHLGLVRLQCF